MLHHRRGNPRTHAGILASVRRAIKTNQRIDETGYNCVSSSSTKRCTTGSDQFIPSSAIGIPQCPINPTSSGSTAKTSIPTSPAMARQQCKPPTSTNSPQKARYLQMHLSPARCVPRVDRPLSPGRYQTSFGAHNHRSKRDTPLPEHIRLITDYFRDAGILHLQQPGTAL